MVNSLLHDPDRVRRLVETMRSDVRLSLLGPDDMLVSGAVIRSEHPSYGEDCKACRVRPRCRGTKDARVCRLPVLV